MAIKTEIDITPLEKFYKIYLNLNLIENYFIPFHEASNTSCRILQ